MTKADTAANGRVTVNQVRAARLVADLARTWEVPVPKTLRDIADADLEPGSTNGHAPAQDSQGGPE